MARGLLLLLLMLSSAFGESVIFHDCGSSYDLLEVRIEGCGRYIPCYVTTGKNLTVTLVFTPHYLSGPLKQVVLLILNNQEREANATPADPCDAAGCPMSEGLTTSYTAVVQISNNVALNTRGHLRWSVYDENSRTVLCYSVIIQTQNRFMKILRSTSLQH